MPKRPSKIVCVGRNYAAHARELGNEPPSAPLLFLKPPSSLLRDGEPIVLPAVSERVDFEGEIGVVVARRLRHASEEEAVAAIAGYVPVNDVTARDLQKTDGQWTRAKGFDTFCPVGALLPAAEADWRELEVVTRVNGAERQRGHARDMVFPIPALLAYVSAIMTIESGDLLATGTPEGVGPLEPGDVVEVEVGGRVRVANPVRRHAP
ncbi:MAG TPA: fumarylacetoacetate hydrolase family protein [Longimicrobiales bacterium]|nr:fumarylacetoacetate hydrolase family protein [Longimicrobiales bacterium]